MDHAKRQGPFWDAIEGRAPMPPAAQLLGWKRRAIDPERGTIHVEFEAREEFLNPIGTVQGGILTAMLDDTMGPALAATLAKGEFAPTLNLNVSFHRPAKVGVIHGKGRVIKRGKDVCYLAGELFQEGELIASATATALVRGSKA